MGGARGQAGGVWEVLHNLGWSWDFLLYARGWLTLPRPAPAQVDKRPLQDQILEGRSTAQVDKRPLQDQILEGRSTAQVDKRPLQDQILEGRSTGNAKQHLPDASGQCDFQQLRLGQLTNQNLGQAV